VAGDALNPDLQEGPFDFVHERLVLMNMPQAQQRTMVSQMLALLKPGGSIALQDYDRVSCVCYPEHPSWAILFKAYADAFSAGGGNGSTGRVLPWLLRSAGARNVKTKIHASFVDVGDSRRTHHLGLLAVMEDKILALGRFGRTEFAEHKQALLEHLAHPDTLLIDHLLVQAWGQAGRETQNRSFRANQRVRGFGRA
jgi:SAM-dependent methyltransferase